ncbi:threonine synthase [Candidatus Vidania fulgoroideorum]
MIYTSTRKKNKKRFSDIIYKNMSYGGLYVPYKFKKIGKEINRIKKYSFKKIINYIFKIFLTKYEYKYYKISKICKKVFNKKNFPLDKNIVSIKKIKNKLFLLKLSNGKSFSFKDIAICFISEIYKNNIKNIICATSGDTGSSCSTFFKKNTNIKTFIFSPYNKISNYQFSQISNILSKNILSVSIKGNFDKCQKIVKNIVNKKNFCTVNSINIIRIIIQISYYLYAFIKIRKKTNFYIPTGNFGNAYSCILLKKLGLPIKITIITNENDMLYNFFYKGIYENNRFTVKTDSPSMDISKSSNIERLIYIFFKKKTKKILNFFNILKKKKKIKIKKINKTIGCQKIIKKERKKIINFFYRKKNYLFDTHTSNAIASYFKNKKKDNVCVLETAKSLKFLEEINIFLKKNMSEFCNKKYNIKIEEFCSKKKKFFYFNSKDNKKILNFVEIYSNK